MPLPPSASFLPLISAIVPVFRVEKYLDECINSIVNQTYRDIEIILVDDGSDDSSPEICDNWGNKDSRIRVIHQRNAGVSHARNVGIEFAHGDFVTFVDGDDWIDERLFETGMKTIVENDADIAVCKHICFDMNGMTKPPLTQSIQAHYISDESEKINLILSIASYENSNFSGGHVTTKLIKKELLKNIRFIEDQTMCEDELFSLLTFKKANRVAFNESASYFYRMRSSSTVHNKHFVFTLLKSRQFMVEKELIGNSEFSKSSIGLVYALKSFNLKNATKEELHTYQKSLSTLRSCFFVLYKFPIKGIRILYAYFIISKFAPLKARQFIANLLYRILGIFLKNPSSFSCFP